MPVELPMPERADEPLSLQTYYNLIPVLQDDAAKPLAVVVQEDRFDEGALLVFGSSLDDGNAHFRVESADGGAIMLRGRNSGKLVFSANGQVGQLTNKALESSAAVLQLVPTSKHRYRIQLFRRPDQQWRAKDRNAPAPGVALAHDAAPGLEFYRVPAANYRWLDSGTMPSRAYQDAAELALRALLGGVMGQAGDLLKSELAIPGGAAVLGFVMDLIWPAKTLDQILQEFRKDLIDDMRNLQAGDALVNATNHLIDVRRRYAMEYRDTKRMDIDVTGNAAALREAARSFAGEFSSAIIGLLPGVTQSDGTIVKPIPAQYASLVRAGLGAYAQGAIDHLTAVQERALIAAFDPAYVVRSYPKTDDGRYLEAGRQDVVEATKNARDRQKTMCLVNIADDVLAHGDRIALRTSNGRYLSAWTGSMGPVTAIRTKRGEWETFRLDRVAGKGALRDGDAVGLVGSDGVYMDGNAAGELTVYVFRRQENSTFTILRAGGTGDLRNGEKVNIKAPNGKFISAVNGGGEAIAATSENRAAWETFTIERVSVGNTLRYGNRVALRRPSDGRFASVSAASDRVLMTDDAKITKSSVFSVEGGTAGAEVPDGGRFRLQTIDRTGSSVGIDANGRAVAVKGEAWFRAEIVRGAPKAGPQLRDEPPDWIEAYAKTYQANIAEMFSFLLFRRYDDIVWSRKEGRGIWSVEMIDKALGKALCRVLEAGPQDFKKTEAHLEEVRREYQLNLAFNELIRYRPVFAARRFSEAKDATVAMFNRLKRDLDASTEFWRDTVVPAKTEWKL
jgi:hypothetical protein